MSSMQLASSASPLQVGAHSGLLVRRADPDSSDVPAVTLTR